MTFLNFYRTNRLAKFQEIQNIVVMTLRKAPKFEFFIKLGLQN